MELKLLPGAIKRPLMSILQKLGSSSALGVKGPNFDFKYYQISFCIKCQNSFFHGLDDALKMTRHRCLPGAQQIFLTIDDSLMVVAFQFGGPLNCCPLRGIGRSH